MAIRKCFRAKRLEVSGIQMIHHARIVLIFRVGVDLRGFNFVSNEESASGTGKNIRTCLMEEVCQVLQLICGWLMGQALFDEALALTAFLINAARIDEDGKFGVAANGTERHADW